MKLKEQLAALKNGNTELLEVLMTMCSQHLIRSVDENDTEIFHHDFISSNEHAFDVLVRAGVGEWIGGNKLKLLWDVLEKRKSLTKQSS